MKADIVFLDSHSLCWIPYSGSVNHIVHAEDATGVRHVMIGGDFALFDRKHTRIDIAKLASEAEAARARLEEGSRNMHALCEKLASVVASFCPRPSCPPLPFEPLHVRRACCRDMTARVVPLLFHAQALGTQN